MKRLLYNALCCALLAAAPLAAAQSSAQSASRRSEPLPRLIKYAGTVSTGGSPRLGIIMVRFAVYAEQTGGAPLWQETQNVQLDEQGRYRALLGSSRELPMSIFSANSARWLGVQVLADSDPEQSRILLVSVPYALKAQDAETLGGRPASDYALREFTASKKGTLSGGAAARSLDTGIVSASGGGTIGSVPKFSATDTLVDSIITEKDVAGDLRVGIGMGATNPASKLQINGRMTAEGFDITTAATDSVHIINSNAAGQGIQVNSTSTSGGQASAVFASTESSNGTAIFAVALPAAGAPTDTSFGLLAYTWNPGAAVMGLTIANDVGAFGGFPTFPETTAVYAGVNSSTAQPLVVQNRHASGTRLVSARNSSGTEVVGMTTAGNITATGSVTATSFSGSGAGLTGVVASSAATATALSSDPAACVANNFVTDIAANGTLTCTQPSSANLSDGASLSTKTYADSGVSTEAAARAVVDAKLAVRGINYIAGCDSCNLLQPSDSEKAIYMNVVGAMTINQVTCISDMGAPTINIKRDDGSPGDILSPDLTCSTGSGTTTTIIADPALSLNDKLDFYVTGGTGVAHRVTVVIKATVN
ncbi:MAG TPA: hypothetical protein VM009_07295 [Terriglobales bacterium]|nr:hypothetical protein [Terriglobales bacterium]